MKSLRCQISHKALLLRYEIWQRLLCRMDTVAGSTCDNLSMPCPGLWLRPEFLASLIQHLPGTVFWLLSLLLSKANARTNRGQRATERKTFTRNTTCSDKMFTHLYFAWERKIVFAIKWTHVYLMDKLCSVLRSLAEASSLRINMYLCVSTPDYSGKDLRWSPYQKSTLIQTYSSASEPEAAQGVGGCTSSSSKATRLSGQLKQACRLAPSYKEPGPARGGHVWWGGDKDGQSPCQLPLSHEVGAECWANCKKKKKTATATQKELDS